MMSPHDMHSLSDIHSVKVLHVIPSVSERSGGPAHAIVPMCRALRALDVEVLLATTNPELVDKPAAPLGGITTYKGLPTVFFPKQFGDSFKYSRPFARWLDSNVTNFDTVHIHAVFNHSCIAAARACRKRGVPYIVRPLGKLDPWSMSQRSLRKGLFWRSVGRRMINGAAAVHYTTRAEQEAAE